MLPLNRNYLKFQFSHFSQTLFQVFTHWTSFPSSIPSIQRPWAFYRQQDIQAKPLRLHSQSSHQGCILCLNRSAHWPDMFTLVSPAKWRRSNLAALVLKVIALWWAAGSTSLWGPACRGLAVMEQAESLLLSIINITVSLVRCGEYVSFIIFSPSNSLE